MSNQIVPASFFMPASWEDAKNMAQALMSSELVPEIYRAIPNVRSAASAMANNMIALNMAVRMKADPLMVMQNLYIVHGKPGISSQFLIGTFNSLGKYSSIDYEFEGDINSDFYGCRAFATDLSTKKVLKGTLITIDMAKKEGWFNKKGSKWQTMPEQMLRYRAAAFFIRTYAPEIALGFQTAEEVEDVRDVSPSPAAPAESLKRPYTKIKGIKKQEEPWSSPVIAEGISVPAENSPLDNMQEPVGDSHEPVPA